MKKKLTAFLLTAAMLCSLMPMAAATSGPEKAEENQRASAGTMLEQIELDGARLVNLDTYVIPEGVKIMKAQLLDESEIKSSAATEIKEAEPEQMTLSAEDDTALKGLIDNNTNASSRFTGYGAQLSSIGVAVEDDNGNIIGLVKGLGPILTKLYNTGKQEISGAYFTNDRDKIRDNLGVYFSVDGATDENCMAILAAVKWAVYSSIDFDCPDMFYSNSYCGMYYLDDPDEMYISLIPLYGAGYEDLSQREEIKTKLYEKADAIIKQATMAGCTTEYDKLCYYHDWLCQNNSYNNAAIEQDNYLTSISADPWSSASGILHSSVDYIEGPVCEGYSRAFQLLCSRSGIRSTVVTSYNHMWNNVRYGKYWTGVDVTWDDTLGSKRYFLTTVNNDGDNSHGLNDTRFVDFTYPTQDIISDWTILPFYDVADAASSSSEFWGKPYIQYVYEQNYMSGLTCVNFGINTSLTRAQFAQILYSIVGKPEVTYINHFSDVPAGQWYTNAVVWADSNDIAHGVSDTRFGVNDAITREQLALMLYKYMGAPYVEEGYIDSFADADEVSEWALTAMNWAVRDGVMNGTNKNELQPTGKATRTATAVMISKVA